MSKYPRIKKLGLTVHAEPIPHVKREDLKKAIEPFAETFHEFFGCQTCFIEGPYPWDVEAVLERIASSKLTGTQLVWD